MSNLRTVSVEWQGNLRFRGGPAESPSLLIDGDVKDAPGPMHTLLVAAAACSGSDIVTILEKSRVDLRKLAMEVRGERAADHPRRYISIQFVITIAGDGLDETKARRAADLSLTKYCSVLQSLNPDIPVTYELKLES
jgi:putative redox protein